MNENRRRLLDALKEYDAANVKFYEAKQKLLQQGFEEYEIIAAASDISYGSKGGGSSQAEKSVTADNLQPIAASPEQILLEDLKKRRREAFGYDKDSIGGLFNSQLRHGSIDVLGLPVGLLLVIGILITAVLYVLSFTVSVLPSFSVKVFLILYLLFIGGWVSIRVIKINQQIDRLERQQGKSSKFSAETIISYLILAALILTVARLF